MKANELMIEDFVFHEKYGNAIIETIDNDFGDKPSIKLISENIKHKDGYKYGYCWCDLNEIFPIPLTPEILEKNGFEKTSSPKRYVFEQNNNRIIVDLKDDYLLQIIYNFSEYAPYTNYVLPHVDYVHQLQHDLRLCEIEKEIII
jgi:hypothetical protein